MKQIVNIIVGKKFKSRMVVNKRVDDDKHTAKRGENNINKILLNSNYNLSYKH